MVRFTLATTVLVSLAATSTAFQSVSRASFPAKSALRASIAANDMLPQVPVTPPPSQEDEPKMDMTGIALSVSRQRLSLVSGGDKIMSFCFMQNGVNLRQTD